MRNALQSGYFEYEEECRRPCRDPPLPEVNRILHPVLRNQSANTVLNDTTTPKHSHNRRMPVFMCRWPNGDLSLVSARNREEAIIALDEFDNAELAELRQIRDFMVDFRLADGGKLELQGFGESCQDEIWNQAYPVLAKAMAEASKNDMGESTLAGKKSIRAAVKAEKQRLIGKSSKIGGHGSRQLATEPTGRSSRPNQPAPDLGCGHGSQFNLSI
jgi:hypothetical protein